MDLRSLLRDVGQLLRGMVGERVRLTIEAPEDLWPVRADAGQIEQILFNLAANARDAMPDAASWTSGPRTRRVSEETRGEPALLAAGEYVLIRVRDTGSGMEESTRQHIFEPFFSTKGDGGTGIGLATVYGIVRQHGGEIWCDSTPGRGHVVHHRAPQIRIRRGTEVAGIR